MPDTTYTFDELDPFALAWHRDGYIWSPGPGGGQPVYRWPIETDDDGNAAEPDLDDPRVNVMRADEFPWSGWRHLADCGCEDCTDEPLLCPACAAERDHRPSVACSQYAVGYSPDLRPNPDYEAQGLCCEYEHCIENMGFSGCIEGEDFNETIERDGPHPLSCPVFGHDCPGGADRAAQCRAESEPMWANIAGRLPEKAGS